MAKGCIAVRETNRKRIRGLWRRGEHYYLQVRIPGEDTPRKILLKASTLTASPGLRQSLLKDCFSNILSQRLLGLRLYRKLVVT
jgi:hypothetical protein